MQQNQQRPITIFSVYAPSDIKELERWEAHLRPLELENFLSVWSMHRHHIQTGDNRSQFIHDHFDTADLFVLLLSANFFADDGCLTLMKRALTLHQQGNTRLISLLLKPVLWQETKLAPFTPLPSNKRPITEWHDPHAAFDDCVRDLCRILGRPVTKPPVTKRERPSVEFHQPVYGSPQIAGGDIINNTTIYFPKSPPLPWKMFSSYARYLEEIKLLLLSLPGSGNAIQEATLAVLKELKGKQKGSQKREILEILYRNGLIGQPPIVDLRGADFSEARLNNLDLSRAGLSGINMSSANLHAAKLTSIDLSDADLSSANFEAAHLRNANLSDAICWETNFHLARLNEADLRRCALVGANLSCAVLPGVKLQGAFLGRIPPFPGTKPGKVLASTNLNSAYMPEAHLNNCNLFEVSLRDADLSGADLTDADLRGSDLYKAILVGARLDTTDMRSTNLYRADLRNTVLINTILAYAWVSDEQLKTTKSLEHVCMPDTIPVIPVENELLSTPYFYPLVDAGFPPIDTDQNRDTIQLSKSLNLAGIDTEQLSQPGHMIYAKAPKVPPTVVVNLNVKPFSSQFSLGLQYSSNLQNKLDYPIWHN
jgi:uncharacterized protein YjbI with pentapeptide repeats